MTVESPEKLVGRAGAFVLHTLAVYVCTLFFSPWLVGRWFAWCLPILQVSATTAPADWYLQHLTLMSIFPALIVGYLAARQRDSMAPWAWLVPLIVLIYRMIQSYSRSSVLAKPTLSTIMTYFFGAQPVMPTRSSFTPGAPVRTLLQMTVTAPFYAGVAYSVGGWIAKRKLVARIFKPESGKGS